MLSTYADANLISTCARRHSHMQAHTHTHTCRHTHAHMQAHTRTCTHAGTHTHTHTCRHTHTYTHAGTHLHTHTHTHTCRHTHAHTRTHMQTHTRTRTRTHAGTHMHTHTHAHTSMVNVCTCCLVHLVCPSVATSCSLLHLLQASPFDMRRQRRREAPTAEEQLTPTSTVSNLTVIKIKSVIIAMLYVELFWLLLQDISLSK